jgi:hypothetical protein
LRSVFVNSPPPKPEVILTNFFTEPTVLLVPITSRVVGVLDQNPVVITIFNLESDISYVNSCLILMKFVFEKANVVFCRKMKNKNKHTTL